MTPAARLDAAIELLEEIENAARRPADAVASDFFRARRFIGGSDRRTVSERVWAVLRGRRRLGWWLTHLSTKVTPRTLIIAHLMVTERWQPTAVAQSFSGGRYAPYPLEPEEIVLVNALDTRTLDHPEMPQAVRLEMPDWIAPMMTERFGNELIPELMAMLEPATLDLRVNLIKATREQAREALRAEDIEATPTRLSPWGLRIIGRRNVTAGKAFQDGLVEIQDEGSQLIAAMVAAKPDMRVLDWCAGAGGKTLAMAMTMDNKGHIAACDTSESRLEGAVRRLRRAGVHNVERHLIAPGDKWAKRRVASFDRVLVDAPCTGTGTWRRNPDARLRLAETDLEELLPKQAQILDTAAKMLKPGGRLVYATCSLLPAENEGQVKAFLARHPDFSVVPLSRAWTFHGASPGGGPYLSLTPRRHETDGFFAAILERAPAAKKEQRRGEPAPKKVAAATEDAAG